MQKIENKIIFRFYISVCNYFKLNYTCSYSTLNFANLIPFFHFNCTILVYIN